MFMTSKVIKKFATELIDFNYFGIPDLLPLSLSVSCKIIYFIIPLTILANLL